MSKKFDQLGVARITKNRNIVVSKCDNGGFTIAQQLETDEGGHMTRVFLKGATFVDSTENLRNVVRMFNDVIRKLDEQDNTNWDDLEADDINDDGTWV